MYRFICNERFDSVDHREVENMMLINDNTTQCTVFNIPSYLLGWPGLKTQKERSKASGLGVNLPTSYNSTREPLRRCRNTSRSRSAGGDEFLPGLLTSALSRPLQRSSAEGVPPLPAFFSPRTWVRVGVVWTVIFGGLLLGSLPSACGKAVWFGL